MIQWIGDGPHKWISHPDQPSTYAHWFEDYGIIVETHQQYKQRIAKCGYLPNRQWWEDHYPKAKTSGGSEY